MIQVNILLLHLFLLAVAFMVVIAVGTLHIFLRNYLRGLPIDSGTDEQHEPNQSNRFASGHGMPDLPGRTQATRATRSTRAWASELANHQIFEQAIQRGNHAITQ